MYVVRFVCGVIWIGKDVESVRLLNERNSSRVWLDGRVPVMVVGIDVSQNETREYDSDMGEVW